MFLSCTLRDQNGLIKTSRSLSLKIGMIDLFGRDCESLPGIEETCSCVKIALVMNMTERMYARRSPQEENLPT